MSDHEETVCMVKPNINMINLQEKYVEQRKRMTPIQLLVDDLYWEYDRMSRSGQETLDKLAEQVNLWNK
tara:strand:- start:508 stop:714 length:207 start_codon:yes stop_codon:yes gene_type:complete